MKAIKSTLFAFTLSLPLDSPALAQPPLAISSNTLSAQDLELLFEQDGEPMQLALLSEKEMAETKGAIWPFISSWATRFMWGGTWGSLLSGYDLFDDGFDGYKSFYQWAGAQIMLNAVASTLTVNWRVGTFLGFGVHVTLSELRQAMHRNGWSVFDTVDHVNDALSKIVNDRVKKETPPESLSASSASSDSSYLVRLLVTFDQNKLRQFLSDIPRNSFDKILARVASDTAREDFLERLPTETVNDFLLAMPEEYMPDFREIIPFRIMNGINRAMASQTHDRHLSSNPYEHWLR